MIARIFILTISISLGLLFFGSDKELKAGPHEARLCKAFLKAASDYLSGDSQSLPTSLEAEAIQAWNALDAFHEEIQTRMRRPPSSSTDKLDLLNFVKESYPGLMAQLQEVLKAGGISFTTRKKVEKIPVQILRDPLTGLDSIAYHSLELTEIVISPQVYKKRDAFWPLVFAANQLEDYGVDVALNPFLRYALGSDGMAEWSEDNQITAYPNNRSFPADPLSVFTVGLHEAIHGLGFKKHPSCKSPLFGYRVSSCLSSDGLVTADEFRAYLYTILFLSDLMVEHRFTQNEDIERLSDLWSYSYRQLQQEIQQFSRVAQVQTDRLRRQMLLHRTQILGPNEMHPGSRIPYENLLFVEPFGQIEETQAVRVSLYLESSGEIRFTRIMRGSAALAHLKKRKEIEDDIRDLRLEQEKYKVRGPVRLIQDGLYSFANRPTLRISDPEAFNALEAKINALKAERWEAELPIWAQMAEDFFKLEAFVKELEIALRALNSASAFDSEAIEKLRDILKRFDP